MNLLNNPIANMYGPHFLIFYSILTIIISIFCYRKMKEINPSDSPAFLKIPTNPEPYELIFLRGGKFDLLRLIILELVREDYLIKAELSDYFIKNPGKINLDKLSAEKREVLEFFSNAALISDIFNKKTKLTLIDSLIGKFEKKFIELKLIFSPQMKKAAVKLKANAFLLITGIGGYKLTVALMKGKSNVFFLIILCIISLIIIFKICSSKHLTKRGKLYLERTQLAFKNLKGKFKNNNDLSLDSSSVLAMSLFGFTILSESAYAQPFEDIFKKKPDDPRLNSSYDSSSGGCGSSSCGGGGGSSCGGGGWGGCGGGGCS